MDVLEVAPAPAQEHGLPALGRDDGARERRDERVRGAASAMRLIMPAVLVPVKRTTSSSP